MQIQMEMSLRSAIRGVEGRSREGREGEARAREGEDARGNMLDEDAMTSVRQ